MRFSERQGISQFRVDVQRKSMDTELRNRLWNALEVTVWRTLDERMFLRGNSVGTLMLRFFGDFLKLPIDGIENEWYKVKRRVRSWYFQAEWFEVYDFLEFIVQGLDLDGLRKRLIEGLNIYLEQENAAYRVVGYRVAEVTRAEEIDAIERALADSHPLTSVNTHLSNALAKLTDRKDPDYRNSVKESISAVEGLCRIISRQQKASLADALKSLESAGVRLHPALRRAWSSLYGYTSDEGGIRHALSDDGQVVTFADAKYMLVSCSAFVSYLTELGREAGIAALS